MTPDENSVITILLYQDFIKRAIDWNSLKQHFGEKKGTDLNETMRKTSRDMRTDNPFFTSGNTDEFIMLSICDKMFNGLLKTLKKKGIPDTYCIRQAYQIAMGQLRSTGEPYIVHPLKVAMILSEKGVESNIIAAAILHDVVEDTTYTIEDIRNKFGEQIAKYVDAVTSVEKEYANSMEISKYSSDKSEMDERTFKKLANYISKDPRMIFALYIKAADRIHNLRTIDEMSSIKKHNKADETDSMYLPLFKRFNLNYFTAIIEDLTWRATNVELYNSIQKAYEEMYDLNAYHIDETIKYMKDCIDSGFRKFCKLIGNESDFEFDIKSRKYYPLEVFNMVKNNVEFYESPVKYIAKRYMPVCDFDIVFDTEAERDDIGSIVTLFIKYYVDHNIVESGRVITDFSNEEFGRTIITIEDEYRNVIRYCFWMNSDYISYQTGSTRGIYVADTNEKVNTEDEGNEIIHVRLRNNREIELPKGSSVIDVAFAIHEEIGLTAKGALINGKEAHIYHMVHDGDKVVVDADNAEDVNDGFIRHARITWLEYVKTPVARKKLIKYLSDRYEGDDPVRESKASTKVVENISDSMMGLIDVNPKERKENQ